MSIIIDISVQCIWLNNFLKQNFHTIMSEAGCCNKSDPKLEVIVAALSGGPVGPSSRYDLFNKIPTMATW